MQREAEMHTMMMKRNLSRTFSLKEWWNAKNGFFSVIAGEKVTNKDVVLANNVGLSLLVVTLTVSVSMTVACAALAWSIASVMQLKKGGTL